MSLCRLRVLVLGLLVLCLLHGFDLIDLSFTRTLAFAGAWGCSVWLWNWQATGIDWSPLKRLSKFVGFLAVVWTALFFGLAGGELVWKKWLGSRPIEKLATKDLYPMLFYFDLWVSALGESQRDQILLLIKDFQSDVNCKDAVAELQRIMILRSAHGEKLNSIGLEKAQEEAEKGYGLSHCVTAKDFCDGVRAKVQDRLKVAGRTQTTESQIEDAPPK